MYVNLLFISILSFFLLFTCSRKEHPHYGHYDEKNSLNHSKNIDVKRAIAILKSTEGHKVFGTVIFENVANGVKISGIVKNLNSDQKHGFHIHEFGDISSKDGSSLGPHFYPAGHEGAPTDKHKSHHAFNLGNLKADSKGVATFEKVLERLSMNPSAKNSIIGRGVVVHAQEDSGDGKAGARVAVGVIGIAKDTK